MQRTTEILSSAKITLEKSWEIEGKPDGEMLIWAKAQSEKDLSKENRDYLVLVELIKQWNAIDIKHKEIVSLNNTIKQSLQTKKNSEEIVNKLKLENTTNNTELLTLLKNAKTYIAEQGNINSCPVCSSDFEKTVVITSLEKQIISMDALDKAAKILDTNTPSLKNPSRDSNVSTSEFFSIFDKSKSTIAIRINPIDTANSLNEKTI
mgnify:CR=1 FL=1